MFDVVNNKIYLSRGDSCSIELQIIDDEGEEYTPSYGEVVVFSLKKNSSQCKTIFEKEFEELSITLDESDTCDLAFGLYYYDVALIDDEGNVYTIIEPTEFNILEVVHNEFN